MASKTPFTAHLRKDRVPVAKFLMQIAPRRSGAGNPKHGFEKEPVVGRRTARIAGFAREKRSNTSSPIGIARSGGPRTLQTTAVLLGA